MSFGIDDPRNEYEVEILAELERHRDLIRFLFRKLYGLLVRRNQPNMNEIRRRMFELEFDPDQIINNEITIES